MKPFNKAPMLLFSLALAGSAIVLFTGSWSTATGPFLHIEGVTEGEEATCKVDDLSSRVKVAISLVEDHMYFKTWRDALHVAGWDPVPYITEKLPEMGTCHGKVFAMQRYIYSHPKAAAQDAASHYAIDDVVLFDVMRLAFTELFQYIHAIQEIEVESPVNVPQIKEAIRRDFQQNANTILHNAHVVDIIELQVNADTDRTALAKNIAEQLAPFSAADKLMTAQVNVISGPKIAHSLLIKASDPDFVLYDINAPGGIVTEGTKNGLFDSLETLLDGTIKHIQKLYFSDEASGNSGYLQIIVYQIQ